MPAPRKTAAPKSVPSVQETLSEVSTVPASAAPVSMVSRVRSTQNTITHVKQPGTSGEGRAHPACDVAFDDATGTATVQSIIDDLLRRVAELEGR